MADLDRVKRNVSRMISMNAPEADVDQYIASEGATVDQVRAHRLGTQPPAAEQPKLSAGEFAGDLVKSTGVGLAQGAIGLATLPGNLETLGRAGINYGADLLGVEKPVSPKSYMWDYNDLKGAVEDRVTGDFYEPKSTAGEYARTYGEFIPATAAAVMTGGASAGAAAPTAMQTTGRVAAGAAFPAVASETAGQMTEGTSYEPYARVAGAIAGGSIPGLVKQAVSPNAATAPQRAAVQQLESEGVTSLTAGQRTGGQITRWLEDATAAVPGSGGKAAAMQGAAEEQFTRAILKRVGVNADRADGPTIEAAAQQIGGRFNAMAQNASITPQPNVAQRIIDVADDYERMTPAGMSVAGIRTAATDIAQKVATNGLQGREYVAFRSELRRAQRGMKTNPQASAAVGRIVEQLDVAVIRSAPRAQRAALAREMQTMNEQYRFLMAIEDAVSSTGEKAASGLISPSRLAQAVRKQNKRDLTRTRTPLAKLARAGEQVITPLRSSGTAERTQAQNALSVPGAMVGGVASAGDPLTMLVTALGPAAAKAATSRAVMSPWGQGYLGNQYATNWRIPEIPTRSIAQTMAPFEATRDDRQRRVIEALLGN
jgi:hypothetical protein